MERTKKRDNYAKEIEKCIGEEERRLEGLMKAVVRERFVLNPYMFPITYSRFRFPVSLPL